ncbi:RAD51-associated protein 1-like [Saccoglossus kowalevskii]|uniref:RAD51-associated protein 1-like n=1 Tax=Saccoglossus kowalevskii TaxID=10224 RepID=A0ABM0GKL1_SACKO|nr:PREDICTED: RAD51-associated protein 1-like [Saccoglossus kowalevskii]
MSDSRRSGRRQRKQVDYSKFCDVESENNSDDDFTEPTPPIAKRPKIAKEKPKKELKLSNNKKKNEERVPLDDKLYQRDLELALKLSKKSSQESDSVVNSENVEDVKCDEESELKKDEVSKENNTSVEIKDLDKNGGADNEFDPASNPDSFVSSESSDEESESEDDCDFVPRAKRKTTSKGRNKGVGRGKRKNVDKSPVKPRMSATVTPVHRAGKLTPKGRGSKPRCTVGFTPPAPVSGTSHASLVSSPSRSIRKPAWCSPSQGSNPLGGVTLKSPNAPLRLGLSKNVRVKPLHPHVK